MQSAPDAYALDATRHLDRPARRTIMKIANTETNQTSTRTTGTTEAHDTNQSSRKRVVLAGGSGFLGHSLAQELSARDYHVTVLTRSPSAVRDKIAGVVYLAWDGRTTGAWQSSLDGAHAIVNLTGKSVDCRYTPENRREIIESRVHSVEALAAAIDKCESPPRAFVQAASLAIYGDAGEGICTEETPPGEGFSPGVCVQWESAVERAAMPQTRKVVLRISFALGDDGGALSKLTRLTKLFLGGTVGSGEQYISWLHIDDLNRIFLRAIEDETMQGTYNATSDAPVKNREFMRELRNTFKRPWSPPVPAPFVRLGARMLGTEAELALTGRRGAPSRLTAEGFEFKHSELRHALADLFPAGKS